SAAAGPRCGFVLHRRRGCMGDNFRMKTSRPVPHALAALIAFSATATPLAAVAQQSAPAVAGSAPAIGYTSLREGSGASPTAADTVKVHYRGTLVDGTEFDSSYKR